MADPRPDSKFLKVHLFSGNVRTNPKFQPNARDGELPFVVPDGSVDTVRYTSFLTKDYLEKDGKWASELVAWGTDEQGVLHPLRIDEGGMFLPDEPVLADAMAVGDKRAIYVLPQEWFKLLWYAKGQDWVEEAKEVIKEAGLAPVHLRLCALSKQHMRDPKRPLNRFPPESKDDPRPGEQAYEDWHGKLEANEEILGYMIPRARAVVFALSLSIGKQIERVELWPPTDSTAPFPVAPPDPKLKYSSDPASCTHPSSAQVRLTFGLAPTGDMYHASLSGEENALPAGSYRLRAHLKDRVPCWDARTLRDGYYDVACRVRFSITNVAGEFDLVNANPVSLEEAMLQQFPTRYGWLVQALVELQTPDAGAALPEQRATLGGLSTVRDHALWTRTQYRAAMGIKSASGWDRTEAVFESLKDHFGKDLAAATDQAAAHGGTLGAATDIAHDSMMFAFKTYKLGTKANQWKRLIERRKHLLKALAALKRTELDVPIGLIGKARLWNKFKKGIMGGEDRIVATVFFHKKMTTQKTKYVNSLLKGDADDLTSWLGGGKANPGMYLDIAFTAYGLVETVMAVLDAGDRLVEASRLLQSRLDQWTKKRLSSKTDRVVDRFDLGELERFRGHSVGAQQGYDKATAAAFDAGVDMVLSVATMIPVVGEIIGLLMLAKAAGELAVTGWNEVEKRLFSQYHYYKETIEELRQLKQDSYANQDLLRERLAAAPSAATDGEVQLRLRAEALYGLVGLLYRAGLSCDDNDSEGKSYLDKVREYRVEEYIQEFILGSCWSMPLESFVPLSLDSYWLRKKGIADIYPRTLDGWKKSVAHGAILLGGPILAPATLGAFAASAVVGETSDQPLTVTYDVMMAELVGSFGSATQIRANFQQRFPIHLLATSFETFAVNFRPDYLHLDEDIIEYSCVYWRPHGSKRDEPWRLVNPGQETEDGDWLPARTHFDQIRIFIAMKEPENMDPKAVPAFPYTLRVKRRDTGWFGGELAGQSYKGIVKPLLESDIIEEAHKVWSPPEQQSAAEMAKTRKKLIDEGAEGCFVSCAHRLVGFQYGGPGVLKSSLRAPCQACTKSGALMFCYEEPDYVPSLERFRDTRVHLVEADDLGDNAYRLYDGDGFVTNVYYYLTADDRPFYELGEGNNKPDLTRRWAVQLYFFGVALLEERESGYAEPKIEHAEHIGGAAGFRIYTGDHEFMTNYWGLKDDDFDKPQVSRTDATDGFISQAHRDYFKGWNDYITALCTLHQKGAIWYRPIDAPDEDPHGTGRALAKAAQRKETVTTEEKSYLGKLGCVIYPTYQYGVPTIPGIKPVGKSSWTHGGQASDESMLDLWHRGAFYRTPYGFLFQVGSEKSEKYVQMGPDKGTKNLGSLPFTLDIKRAYRMPLADGTTAAQHLEKDFVQDAKFLESGSRPFDHPPLFEKDKWDLIGMFIREGADEYRFCWRGLSGVRLGHKAWTHGMELVVAFVVSPDAIADEIEAYEHWGRDWQAVPASVELGTPTGFTARWLGGTLGSALAGPSYATTLCHVGQLNADGSLSFDAEAFGNKPLGPDQIGQVFEPWKERLTRALSPRQGHAEDRAIKNQLRAVMNPRAVRDRTQPWRQSPGLLFAAHVAPHYQLPHCDKVFRGLRPFGPYARLKAPCSLQFTTTIVVPPVTDEAGLPPPPHRIDGDKPFVRHVADEGYCRIWQFQSDTYVADCVYGSNEFRNVQGTAAEEYLAQWELVILDLVRGRKEGGGYRRDEWYGELEEDVWPLCVKKFSTAGDSGIHIAMTHDLFLLPHPKRGGTDSAPWTRDVHPKTLKRWMEEQPDQMMPVQLPTPKPGDFLAGKFQAAVDYGGGLVYFFKGDKYYRYDKEFDECDPGYPKPIAGQWEGVPSVGIKSAFRYGNIVYIFWEGHYCRFNPTLNGGAGKSEGTKDMKEWKGLADIGWTDFDSAFYDESKDRAYFFKGSEYVRYIVGRDEVEGRGPLSAWKLRFNKVDAAISYGDRVFYFFSGTKYVRGWYDSQGKYFANPASDIKGPWGRTWEEE